MSSAREDQAGLNIRCVEEVGKRLPHAVGDVSEESWDELQSADQKHVLVEADL